MAISVLALVRSLGLRPRSKGVIKALHERLPTTSAARLHLLDALVAVERAVRELGSAEGQSERAGRPA